MGTILDFEQSLLNFIQPSQKLTKDLVKLLINKFQDGQLSLGQRVTTGKSEAKYAITDSEFENIFLELRCREENGLRRYEVALFTTESFDDLILNFTAQLSDGLLEELPKQMIINLDAELDRMLWGE